MGQQLAKPGRRRLMMREDRSWFFFRQNYNDGLQAEIFGGWDYGYDETYQVVSSWLTWALVTWGSFSIDIIEAGLILGVAFFMQEHDVPGLEKEDQNGASWIHNVQAGYCWYHYFVKGRRDWPVFLGTWSEVAGDLGAIAEELSENRMLYSHKAHYFGAAEGMSLAFLFDMFRPKKQFKKRGWLMFVVPFAVMVAMFLKDKDKGSMRSSVARLSDAMSDAR